MDQEQLKLSMQMTNHKKTLRNLAVFIFSVGILFGMTLAGVATWTDLEANFYNLEKVADESLTTLRCPVLMTVTETGTITATFSNPSDLPVAPRMRAYISNPGPLRTIETTISLAPGETKQVHWAVTSEDVDYGDLILIKVLAFSYYKSPIREGTCGILVLSLPHLTGNQIFASTLAFSLLGMLIGVGLWVANSRPLKGRMLDATHAMIGLTAVVLVDMVISFRGAWLFGVLLFLVAVLLIAVIIANTALAS